MKKIGLLLLICSSALHLHAQSAEDYAVEITASVQTTPPVITLKWRPISGDTAYWVFKKAKSDLSWGSAIADLPSTDTVFSDSAVVADSAYEYNVIAFCTSWYASGYIFAGIQNPPLHDKGTIAVLVDTSFSDSCATGISQLMADLSGDGWRVLRHEIPPSLPDTAVKHIIASDYALYPEMNSVLLLGHIAVPYSADFDTIVYPPDGHVPYHQGAWPADIYYGSILGLWTDMFATDTLGSWTANWNVPGDGKWDQDSISAPCTLEVGRVDFDNMPVFGTTPVQMMNSYLARDHAYKMNTLNIAHRALISDNFGAFGGEAFAANGWRNFAPLLSRDSVQVIPFIASLADSSFQWAYGCGGGSFQSAGGIGATSDFAANPVNGIFVMLFGSFFADWNVQNDFLRAPLCAATPALTNCWAGRPNWFFHHMALGENIGYSARLSQNNNNYLYNPGGYGTGYIHVALMGDPSLRTDYILQPSGMAIASYPDSGAFISWAASPDPMVEGYYVYRSDSLYGHYTLKSGLLSTLSFLDTNGSNGMKYYRVRPSKLITTPSGSYHDLGVGIIDSAAVTYHHPLSQPMVDLDVYVDVFPNPASHQLFVRINAITGQNVIFSLLDGSGHEFAKENKTIRPGVNQFSTRVDQLPAGNYMVALSSGNQKRVFKWVKL